MRRGTQQDFKGQGIGEERSSKKRRSELFQSDKSKRSAVSTESTAGTSASRAQKRHEGNRQGQHFRNSLTEPDVSERSALHPQAKIPAKESLKGKQRSDSNPMAMRSPEGAAGSFTAHAAAWSSSAHAAERADLRTVYRLMDKSELDRVIHAKESIGEAPHEKNNAFKELVAKMDLISSDDSEIGNSLFDHTMTKWGGGQIGGEQPLVSMTSNVSMLAESKDPVVQKIVANASHLATFKLPKDAVLGAPSELSKSEGEVVVPNYLQGLGAGLTAHNTNPFKSSNA